MDNTQDNSRISPETKEDIIRFIKDRISYHMGKAKRARKEWSKEYNINQIEALQLQMIALRALPVMELTHQMDNIPF